MEKQIPSIHFMGTIMSNIDNTSISDEVFRDFIRNTLPLVSKPPIEHFSNSSVQERVKKYYK